MHYKVWNILFWFGLIIGVFAYLGMGFGFLVTSLSMDYYKDELALCEKKLIKAEEYKHINYGNEL